MTTMKPETADELWWANPTLKARLEADPAAVLRERGVNVPSDLPTSVVHEFVRVAYLLWQNDALVPVDQFFIDPADEGLLFGRGLWESTRTIQGSPWLWPLHLDRLKLSAKLLYIDLKPERLPSIEQVKRYVDTLTTQDVVIRLNVSAGRPGQQGLVWMSAAPMPYQATSLRLRSCISPVQKGQAHLTLKTFQYATRLHIGQQAAQNGFDSALLLDDKNNLLESSHANIFLRFPEGWLTPTADGGFLPGTVRQHLLDSSPIPIREQVIPYARLHEASEVFVSASNLGIMPITKIDQFSFQIGPETQALKRWVEPPASTATQYRFVERLTPMR